MTLARETFHEQIRSNKRRSLLLIVVVFAIFVALSWFMGFYFAGDPANAVFFMPIGGLVAAA